MLRLEFLIMQELDNVGYLLFAQIRKRRHAFIGATVPDDRNNQVSLDIVAQNGGANEIRRPGACCVRAMTESATGAELIPAASDSGRILRRLHRRRSMYLRSEGKWEAKDTPEQRTQKPDCNPRHYGRPLKRADHASARPDPSRRRATGGNETQSPLQANGRAQLAGS